MLKLFLLLCTALGSIQDCSKGESLLQITALDLVPAVPIVGQHVVMTLQFNNPELAITSGTATNSVVYNFIKLQPIVEDLCVNTPCPLVTGFNDRSTNSTWPAVKGNIDSTITWKGLDGSQLLCIKVSVKTAISRLRGKNISGISLFKDNGRGNCPIEDFLGKEMVLYRQWSKTKRTNSSRTPEEL